MFKENTKTAELENFIKFVESNQEKILSFFVEKIIKKRLNKKFKKFD